MKQYLAVSALGADRAGLVHDFTRTVTDFGGTIGESRMVALGAEYGFQLLISGNWHALAKLEAELVRMGEAAGLAVKVHRTAARPRRDDHLPYSIDVVCLDQPGIVSGLAGFFASRSIEIGEVATRSYIASQTGASMFSVQMMINVPTRIHVSQLREEFMEYCDSLNLDAILEPVKN
ncbi:MAG: glycine cleavage system protein R [Proteobacteria bacterium]|nr:MAG: glycine cleavage system protein R [Pseudomonadota bacterium]